MRVAPLVTLDNTQRHTLQQWARSRSLPARQVERARVILLAAEGKTDLEIAVTLNISNQKAARWRKRFSAIQSGRSREGCAPSRAQTRYLGQDQRGTDSENDAVETDERDSLEHAQYGHGNGRQRGHRPADLARPRPEASLGSELQNQQG